MAASSKITAALTATAQGMQKGIGKVVSSLNSVTKTSAKTQKALSRMSSGINFLVFDKIASYAARAGRAFVGLATNALKTVDAIGKLSKSTGISAEGLQAFSLAASDAGVDQVALSGAFGRMSKRLAEAAKGFGEAKPALEQLGLSAANLVKLSPDEQFLRIGEAIGGLATEGEKAAVAFKIFSDQGLRLVPLFDDIRKKTGAAQEELSQLGILLSKREISNVEALNDSLSRVQKTLTGIVEKVVAELAPAVKLVADDWLGFVKESNGSIVTGIADALKTAAIAAAGWYDSLAAGIQEVVDFFREPPDWVQATQDTGQAAGGIGQGFAALGNRLSAAAAKAGQFTAGAAAFVGVDGADELSAAYKRSAEEFWNTADALSASADENVLGIKRSGEEMAEATKKASEKQISTADKLRALFASMETKVKENRILGPFGPDAGTGVIDKFMAAALQASNTVTEQVKKDQKNRLVGLDARSQAGLNFLLQSGVAGKKPEEKTAKNTAEAVVLLKQIRDLDKVDLTVAIP